MTDLERLKAEIEALNRLIGEFIDYAILGIDRTTCILERLLETAENEAQ